MNKQILIGDYYSQLALLNTLKLQGVDVADFNALQSILMNDKQYEHLFKDNCAVSVKIGLTLKLKTELEYQLKINRNRAKDDIRELKEMVKNLSNKPTIDLFEMKQQVNDLHTIVTKKPLPVEKVLSSKQKMKKEIEEIREQRKLNALLQKN